MLPPPAHCFLSCRISEPEYLPRELQRRAAYDEPRRRLRSASSQRLIVRRTRLRTAGDRAFGAAAPRLWNSLPADVVTSQSLATFKERLKHFCSNSHTADNRRLCHMPLQPSRLTTGYIQCRTYLLTSIRLTANKIGLV